MIADLIKKAREEAGLTQKELAERVGLYQPNIQRLETGKHDPGVEMLGKVVAGMGYTVQEFLNKYAPKG